MKKSFIWVILCCACGLNLQAQHIKPGSSTGATNKYSKTTSGLEYQIIKDSTSKELPEKGGFITFWFEIRNNNDSIIDSQFYDPNPVGIPTPEITYKPSIEEGFLLLTEGDSAVFLLNADSLYTNTFRRTAPEYLKPGSMIQMIVRMGKVYSKDVVDSAMAAQEERLASEAGTEEEIYKKDSIAIRDYLKKNKLKGQRAQDGSYVVILKSGKKSKTLIRSGEEVEATYVGTLLADGTEFDRSRTGEYFKFTVGVEQVIKGWDEGFQKLKHGDKALILIPSRSAYGGRGAGAAIPPNAPLIFEVEVK